MQRAKKYLVWTWIIALFTATMGLSVQQIYCYCLDKTTVSFFSGSTDACKDRAPSAVSDCCKKNSKSCCSKSGRRSHPGKPCTRKTTRVFQLKTEYIVEKQAEKNGFALIVDAEAPFFSTLPVFQNTPLVESVTEPPDEVPPPRSGRSLCILFCNIRC